MSADLDLDPSLWKKLLETWCKMAEDILQENPLQENENIYK